MFQTNYLSRQTLGADGSDLFVRMAPFNGVTDVVSASTENTARDRKSFLAIHRRNSKPVDQHALLTGVEPSPMSRAFFSKENVLLLQNAIGAEVYRQSGDKRYIIPFQNPRVLGEHMHAAYESGAPYAPGHAREDIQALNDLIVREEVRVILRNIDFELFHRQRMSTLPVETERAQSVRPEEDEWKPIRHSALN